MVDEMDVRELLEFLRQHRLAVQASVFATGGPQAAVVGFAITDRFEIIFDTLDSTRKVPNLRQNPKLALVIGGLVAGDERTVQYEGIADEPSGTELERLTKVYYDVFPDGPGRRSWPGLVYVRVRPTWIRYSDYNVDPPKIVEFKTDQLAL
jgi:general stress protein 26